MCKWNAERWRGGEKGFLNYLRGAVSPVEPQRSQVRSFGLVINGLFLGGTGSLLVDSFSSTTLKWKQKNRKVRPTVTAAVESTRSAGSLATSYQASHLHLMNPGKGNGAFNYTLRYNGWARWKTAGKVSVAPSHASCHRVVHIGSTFNSKTCDEPKEGYSCTSARELGFLRGDM